MKSTLKVVLVTVVILGLVASYVLTGRIGGVANTRTASIFKGPTDQPSTNGPTENPPVDQ